MRPYRIGTSSGTRDPSCAASTSRARLRSGDGVHSRWLERGTCFRASFPRATESVTATPRDWHPAAVLATKIGRASRVAHVRPLADSRHGAGRAAGGASPASAASPSTSDWSAPRAPPAPLGRRSGTRLGQLPPVSSQAATAKRYGASSGTIRRFKRAVRRHGLRARVDRSRVFARVSGSVRRFERVSHPHPQAVQQRRVREHLVRGGHSTAAPAARPAAGRARGRRELQPLHARAALDRRGGRAPARQRRDLERRGAPPRGPPAPTA